MNKHSSNELLTYTIEGQQVAEILGIQNFTTKETAILELVKNAYDAGATRLIIKFEGSTLVIKDNGEGMTERDIRESWMHIGKSTRGYYAQNACSRVTAGSKGIGRFALARLGNVIEMRTKRNNAAAVIWKTDWNVSQLEKNDSREVGTCFYIRELRDNWTKKSIKQLAKYLSIVYNEQSMWIDLSKDGNQEKIKPYYQNPQIGKQFVSRIDLEYFSQSQSLKVVVKSDEFLEEAQQYHLDDSIYYKELVLNEVDELKAKNLELSENSSLLCSLAKIGDFKASLFFSLGQIPEREKKTFLYKHGKLKDRYAAGVTLYRNAFGIATYDGKKDWLGLSRRASSSPAAASHPSGSWHVRNSQLSGFVLIDKNENYELKELSNRQGLEENDSYHLFIEIILSGISAFERYRQSIIRDIKEQTPDEESENSIPMMSSIIKNPKKILDLDEKEHLALAAELKSFVKKTDRKEEQKQEVIERLKYDTRILNTLATSGLKSTSLAHELKNSKNFILSAPRNLEEALKQFGYWDDLLSPEKTKYSYHNVPSIIERLDKANERIAYFISSVLDDVENQRFIKIGINPKEIINGIVTRWTSYYKWVHVRVKDNSAVLIFNISEDILRVIFDNLILNSIQQNSNLDQLLINIDISKQEDKLLFDYYDNGVGLSQKYKDEPARIFESHETTRPNGHGLGMWILKNTLDYCGGEIIDIPTSQKGFKLSFSIGEIDENGN